MPGAARPEAAAHAGDGTTAVTRIDALQRFLDSVLVVVGLPIWLPLFGVALVAMFCAGCRPIFFTQQRMGRNCRPFKIYKLRTMRSVPPPLGALFEGWTYANDPRVTEVGAFLRRYRLDELPQLWNVLRGDMSLVGPRPEPLAIANTLGEQLPGYHVRHSVRPGLTGLCQVSRAYRDFGTVEKSAIKLQYDLQYVRTRGLWLYGRILLRTVLVLLRGEGMA